MSPPAHGAPRGPVGSSCAMRESGQTIVEWLAVLAGVVTLAGAATVAMPSVAPAVSGGMHTAICDVTGGSCGAQAEPAAPAAAADGRGHAGREPDLTPGEHRAARAGPVRLELLQRPRAVVHARLREPRPLLRSPPGQGRLRHGLPQRHARNLREAPIVGQRELELHARLVPCRRAPLLQGRGDRGRPLLLPPRRLSRRRVAHTAWRSCSTSARRRIFPAGVRGIASTKRTARMRL